MDAPRDPGPAARPAARPAVVGATPTRSVLLGTRGSQLALAQAGHVAEALHAATGLTSHVVRVKVEGDDHSVPLDRPSRPGMFTSALRDALLAGRVDYVVHSYKDLPSEPCPGLVIVAVPPRATPLDVLVGPSEGLSALPYGATVGTSSPRRRAALARLRPDLQVVAVRGNVDTRLHKVADGTVSAAVMAAAGLTRVGLMDPSWPYLTPDLLLPAPAQGALAVECREGDPLIPLLAKLDHPTSRLTVAAERAVLTGIEAACTTAVGALATWDGRVLTLEAELSDHMGVDYARVSLQVEIVTRDMTEALRAAWRLGMDVAALLLSGPPTPPVAPLPAPAAPLPTPDLVRATTRDKDLLMTTTAFDPTPSDLLRAYGGARTAHRPVWFMRQAGRSLPEYRQAREGTTMLESCLTPELAAELTCQPVRRHKVDAAIFYSDIMIPAKIAGIEVDIVPGRGPVLAHPLRTAKDVADLPDLDPISLAPITQGVQAAVAQLGSTPLIGFAGAPFTVASYLVEGAPSRTFEHVKALMAEDEETWHRLAAWVARTASQFLLAQVQAGAQVVQLFDSWVGALSVDEYTRYAAPHSSAVFDAVAARTSVPRVHFGTGTSHLMVDMHAAGATVMGVDTTQSLAQAEARLGGEVPLQGNIDPELLAAPWETLEQHVREVLRSGELAPGHVVNLGHGVPPTTDPDRLTRLVELIHSIPDENAVDAAS